MLSFFFGMFVGSVLTCSAFHVGFIVLEEWIKAVAK